MNSCSLINDLFDQIYVVSLPSSHDRRAYIQNHLIEAGIENFVFHDACGTSHPDVLDFIESDRVHSYPPCFRCGRASCGREDCNNVLIPAQIATFVTYMNLWKRIASAPQFSLVIEDDLALNPYWPETLKFILAARDGGQLDLTHNTPRLLRLGWALNNEHSADAEFRFSDESKMSNPCHAMTSAYAQALLDRFEKIDTTVDIYIHRSAPRPGEAITVFPPMASELSWSNGQFESLIHPKEIRARFLEKNGQTQAAESQRERVLNHQNHIYHRSVLVLGHPRSGTGYCASILNQFHLDIGHEKNGKDGISSWMFAVDDEDAPYAQDQISRSRRFLHWDHLIHVVRNLETAIPSVIRENRHAPASYEFRKRHIRKRLGVDLDAFDSEIDKAVLSVTFWSRIILELSPDFVFRIEDGEDELARFCQSNGLAVRGIPEIIDTSPVNADKNYRGKKYPKPDLEKKDWDSLSALSQSETDWYCRTFGYSFPLSTA